MQVWLKQPLVDLEEIKRRHDVVEALVEDASLRQDLQMHLRGERLSFGFTGRAQAAAACCSSPKSGWPRFGHASLGELVTVPATHSGGRTELGQPMQGFVGAFAVCRGGVYWKAWWSRTGRADLSFENIKK